MEERGFVRPGELTDLVRDAFGSARRLVELTRLTGGTKKGVYRLVLDDGTTSVLYVWSDDENYWPDPGSRLTDPADPFADASGIGYFLAAEARLRSVGVRTPSVQLADDSRRRLPADFALTEDIRGGTLEQLIERSPGAAAPALDELGAMLAAMHGHRAPRPGKVSAVEADGGAPHSPVPQVVFDRALRDLASASRRVAAIGAHRQLIERHMRALAAAVRPRDEYGLIHGELGPDHVLIDDDGRPVLIDIEGVMFLDVEWEHAFLRMRFGPWYGPLGSAGLDEDRLRFYEFAQSLSLIEGPLRLAEGDFPNRDFALWIAATHTDKVLRLVGAAGAG